MNESLFVLNQTQEKDLLCWIYEYVLWRKEQINEKLCYSVAKNGKTYLKNDNVMREYIRYQSIIEIFNKKFPQLYISDFKNMKITESTILPHLIQLLFIDLPQLQSLLQSRCNNNHAAVTTTTSVSNKRQIDQQQENNQESTKDKKRPRVSITSPINDTTPNTKTKQSTTAATSNAYYDNTKNNDEIDSIDKDSEKTASSEVILPQCNIIIPVPKEKKSSDNNNFSPIIESNDDDDNTPGGFELNVSDSTESENKKNIIASFDVRLKELEYFKARYGPNRVPVKNSELGQWVSGIRNIKRQMDQGISCCKTLSEEQINRLDLLGFEWNGNSAKTVNVDGALPSSGLSHSKKIFESRFNELVNFKATNGHTRVPVSKNSLGQWVSTIRSKKRELDEGKPCSTLSQEQIERLDSIGFEWKANPDNVSFDERIEALNKYKKINHHCDVPISYKDDSSLGDWVKEMRKKYRKNMLTAERIKRLENVGFRWRVRPKQTLKTFEERLEELVKFKEREGHVDVPTNYQEDPSLFTWVKYLRKKYQEKTLTEERIKLLENVGFKWFPDTEPKIQKKFEERLEECRNYRRRHGHLKIPHPHSMMHQTEEEGSFFRWASYIRKQYRKWKAGKVSNMNESRFNKLNEMDFAWTYDDSAEYKEKIYSRIFDERLQELKELKEKVGSCNTLQDFRKGGYSDTSGLYHWAKELRKYWEKSMLSEVQVKKLEELNFDFQPSKRRRLDAHFDERLRELKQLKEKVGSCNTLQDFVKGGYNDMSPLYRWVKLQRRYWKKSKLSEDEVKKLAELDFDLNPRGHFVHFDDRLQELKELKEKVGSCNTLQDFVKGGYTSKSPLYYWAVQQRKMWTKSELSEEKVKKLEGLNFDFNPWSNRLRRPRGRSCLKNATAKAQKAKGSKEKSSREDEDASQCEDSSSGDDSLNDTESDLDGETSSDDETDSGGEMSSDDETDSDGVSSSDDEEADSDDQEASDEEEAPDADTN